MEPVTIGLTAAGLAGQIFSAFKGGQQYDKNQRILNDLKAENEMFYNTNVNRDFLETNAAKGIFERLRKQYRDVNKNAENTAAVTGATPEAEIAMKSENQENYNEAVNQIAGQATQYQQNQQAMYRGVKSNLANQQMQINDGVAESAANVAGNAADLIGAAANLPSKKYTPKEPFHV